MTYRNLKNRGGPKRRQNTHQHTHVQHLWGLLSAGCCLVTEGPVGSIRETLHVATKGMPKRVIIVMVIDLYLTTIIAFGRDVK